MPPVPARRHLAVVVATLAVLGAGLWATGCGGTTSASRPSAAAPSASTSTSTSPSASTSLAPVPSTSVVATTSPSPPSTTSCSNLKEVSGWPVARRAAQLVVAPVLNFDPAVIDVARAAEAGGILVLGSAGPPANLATELSSPTPGGGLLAMADQEGGGVQRLGAPVPAMPWPRVMAETMTTDQVQALATSVGSSMRQLGIDVNLAPVLDLDAGPGPSARDPDGLRSFSAVPARAARYGVAFMHGMQAAGVVPVVKHFPGLGGASANTDYGPATTLPLATLRTGGLIPFQAAIAAGAPAVMVANAAVPGLTTRPASLSPDVINGLLRHDLGFDGLVLTDSLSAGAISQSGYLLPQAAVAAISAGADMVLFGSTLTAAQTTLLSPANVAATIHTLVAALEAATANGSLAVTRLNTAVAHVLAAKRVQLCP
jgi:beta-N-acetylhexosaminidase